MKRPPRVVIDTNVLVSMRLAEQGTMLVLRGALESGALQPLASGAVLAEAGSVLRRKFGAAGDAFFEAYKARCEITAAPFIARALRTANPPVPQCRDPKDQCYLDLAYAARAGALITGDKDLLSITGRLPAPVLKAADFLKLFL